MASEVTREVLKVATRAACNVEQAPGAGEDPPD